MASINKAQKTSIRTHEGAPAKHINAELQLRRSIMACLLWEKGFYEGGMEIALRIESLIPKVKAEVVAQLAIEAREQMKLRHIPLWIVRIMAKLPTHKHLVAATLERVIQRADELTEFVAIYWKDGKEPLSGQVKKGLAKAFTKFNAYALGKYNRDGAVKLRDVLFLCHAKPKDAEQAAVWKKLAENTLESPDTWEVALSGGKDKKETWERLLRESKLGGMALLRNLRNMQQLDIDEHLVLSGLKNMHADRILPFRFIAAARYAPQWEPPIEDSMMRCLQKQEKLSGKTVLLIDVSGSMDWSLSAKSDMTKLDAACGVAMLAREICEEVSIYSFSLQLKQIPPRHGFALRDAIVDSQKHNATYLGRALGAIKDTADRIIVITDEQSHDTIPNPKYPKGYMINIDANQHGVGYGRWLRCDGWSEAVINYIREYEKVV